MPCRKQAGLQAALQHTPKMRALFIKLLKNNSKGPVVANDMQHDTIFDSMQPIKQQTFKEKHF